MGKTEDLRALKDARRAAEQPQPRSRQGATDAAVPCGHRSIAGKTCTRPVGHAEANHRY